jgi:hypothetical protein
MLVFPSIHPVCTFVSYDKGQLLAVSLLSGLAAAQLSFSVQLAGYGYRQLHTQNQPKQLLAGHCWCCDWWALVGLPSVAAEM